jgi:diguanylate cyclase (GGDEF)-like protein/PAS domain S-box-containing protein
MAMSLMPPESGDDAYRALLDRVEVGVAVVRLGGSKFVNARMAAMHGYTPQEMVALPQWATVHPDDRAWIDRLLRWRPAGMPSVPCDFRAIRKDGSLFDARVVAQQIVFGGERCELITVTDIGELQGALRLSEWRARMLAQIEALCRSGSVEIGCAPGFRLTFSAGLWALLGLPPTHEPQSPRAVLRWVPRDERRYVLSIWRGAVPNEPFEFQHRMVCADGKRRVVLHRGMLQAADTRQPHGVAILQDITSQREAESRVEELVNYDEATGLPNRMLLLDRVDEAIHAAWRDFGSFALVALRIEQVEQVRRSAGYAAADALAAALAGRIKRVCAAEEMLAYLGEGEFALLLDPAIGSEERSVLSRVGAVQEALAEPERLGRTELALTCSCGVAGFPHDGRSPQELLQAAQAAMNLGAEGATGQVVFFTPEANLRAQRRLAVESGLRHAAERGELALYYQPQVDLQCGEVIGAEVRVHWHHPVLGEVPSTEFIPVAEQTGSIVALGEWMLRQVCRQSVVWQQAGQAPLRLSLNLSPRQLEQPDIAQRVQAIVQESAVEPSRLGLEVTESMLAANVAHAARALGELRALGMEIALGSFGTGYSNLSYLRSLPIDVIKIDRSFVHDVTSTPADVSLTRAVITLAHSLKMRVSASDVNTEGELALLLANGCDRMQGDFFSAPVTANELEAMLAQRRKLPERFVYGHQRRRTLLLVDDEENVVAALKRLLRRDGYHIVTAHSGAEGLQRLAEVEVDVIVSDQRMPGMTGVEFLRRAKALYPDTVRMVLSGYTELQSITDAVNEGAIYKFLTKPWDDERLRAHIEEAFRQKGMADENRRLNRELHQANGELAHVNERLQRLLALQREQTSLEEGRAAGAREVLENLPAPVIGFDTDGLIAFVNRDAQVLLPPGAALLGREAQEALPPALCALWRRGDGIYRNVDLAGHRYRAACRVISGGSHSRGKLLLMTPVSAEPPPD